MNVVRLVPSVWGQHRGDSTGGDSCPSLGVLLPCPAEFGIDFWGVLAQRIWGQHRGDSCPSPGVLLPCPAGLGMALGLWSPGTEHLGMFLHQACWVQRVNQAPGFHWAPLLCPLGWSPGHLHIPQGWGCGGVTFRGCRDGEEPVQRSAGLLLSR